MKIRRRREITVSEAELTALTADLADAHRDTLPGMLAAANEMGASRRSFLLGAGALLGGVAIRGDRARLRPRLRARSRWRFGRGGCVDACREVGPHR